MWKQRHVENINVNGAAQNIRIKHKALEPSTHTHTHTNADAVREACVVVVGRRGIVTMGLFMCARRLSYYMRKRTHARSEKTIHTCHATLVCVCVCVCVRLLSVDAPQ